jgi:hypothetical protein
MAKIKVYFSVALFFDGCILDLVATQNTHRNFFFDGTEKCGIPFKDEASRLIAVRSMCRFLAAKRPMRTCANLPTYGVLVRQARRNRKGLAPLATSTYK